MRTGPIVTLKLQSQFWLCWLLISILILIFVSVCCVLAWDLFIFIELSNYRFLFGFNVTVSMPLATCLIVVISVLIPALCAVRALVDIGTLDDASKLRGIDLTYFSVYVYLLAMLGFVCLLCMYGSIRDTNDRLKVSTRRYMYDFAQNDRTTVEQLNRLHFKFNCCGVENVSSWMEMGLENWHPQMALAVPDSCCLPEGSQCFNLGLHINYSKSDVHNGLRLQGCRKIVNRYFRQQFLPVFYLLTAVYVWQLILAFILLLFAQNGLLLFQQQKEIDDAKRLTINRKRIQRAMFNRLRLKRLQSAKKLTAKKSSFTKTLSPKKSDVLKVKPGSRSASVKSPTRSVQANVKLKSKSKKTASSKTPKIFKYGKSKSKSIPKRNVGVRKIQP